MRLSFQLRNFSFFFFFFVTCWCLLGIFFPKISASPLLLLLLITFSSFSNSSFYFPPTTEEEGEEQPTAYCSVRLLVDDMPSPYPLRVLFPPRLQIIHHRGQTLHRWREVPGCHGDSEITIDGQASDLVQSCLQNLMFSAFLSRNPLWHLHLETNLIEGSTAMAKIIKIRNKNGGSSMRIQQETKNEFKVNVNANVKVQITFKSTGWNIVLIAQTWSQSIYSQGTLNWKD